MKQLRQGLDAQEPIGIVIADGGRAEVTPRFIAYVWGPAPEEPAEVVSEPKAA